MEILDRVMIAMIKLKVTLHIIQSCRAYICNRRGCYCYGEHARYCVSRRITSLLIKQAEIVGVVV